MGKKNDRKEKFLRKINDIIINENERPVIIDGVYTDYTVTRDGDVLSYKFVDTDEPRKLAQCIDEHGYHMVNLIIDGKERTYKVYRLVASAFIENDDPVHKTQVNHIDGDKDNNHDWNLEWATPSQNIIHAYRTGLLEHTRGEDHPMAKIDEETARRICEFLVENEKSYTEIAEITGATYTTIKKIRNGYRWKDVSKDYDFSHYVAKRR